MDDGVLIKDNHIALAGGITEAITAAKLKVGHLHKIEIEVMSEAGLREALAAGADIIMLDNQTHYFREGGWVAGNMSLHMTRQPLNRTESPARFRR